MNKTDLIQKVSEHEGLSRQDVERTLEGALFQITKAVRDDEPVRITGFGTFKLRPRSARVGRNPQTGAAVKIKASKGIAFAAGATLKADLNARAAPKRASAKAPDKAAKAPAKSAPASRATATKAAKAPAKAAPARKAVATRSAVKAVKTTAKKAPARKR